MDEDVIDQWREAATDAEVDAAIRAIYAEIAAATDARRPRCDRSGRCCHFDKFGHRMYVTGLETAWFLNQLSARDDSPSLLGSGSGDGSSAIHWSDATHPHADPPDLRGGGDCPTSSKSDGACPFLRGGSCSVHEIRPMGCRIFFCDPTATDWQNELYERMHERIIALHAARRIPYRYGEWRAMLRSVSRDERVESIDSAPRQQRSEFIDVRITP